MKQITVQFFAPGLPITKGSKKSVGMNRRTGQAILVEVAKGLPHWMKTVATCAREELKEKHGVDRLEIKNPIFSAIYYIPIAPSRLKGKNALAPNDPHTQKRDLDKMNRAIYDSITGILIKDDGAIWSSEEKKLWCLRGDEGAFIEITGDVE